MSYVLEPEVAEQEAANVYSHLEWYVEAELAKHYARGRTTEDAMPEVRDALLKTVLGSPVFAVRNFFYTVSKTSDLVLIDPWVGQTMLDYTLECQRRAGRAQRIVEIKARQVGFTAWNLARAFWAALHPRMKVGVLVNDDDVAATLMLRVGEMYNNLPKWLRPMKRIDNVKQLVFDNPSARARDRRPGLGSNIAITVPESLRGFTPNYFIWSEASFCKEWRKVNDGVIGGMGAHANSCVVIDTTPNGYDEFYWPLVQAAVERNPEWVAQWERKGAPTREEVIAGILGQPDDPNGYVPVFCPWHWHEEFTTRDEHPQGQLPPLTAKELQHLKATLGKREEFGGDEELELVNRYGCSLFRIAWRRFKIRDMQGADMFEKLLKFRQEYPSSWRGGFVNFGRGAFDVKGLDKLGTWTGPGSKYGPRPPLATGILRCDGRGEIYCDQTSISEWMEVRIWALPDPNERYVIGVDTASSYGHEDADHTVAIVLRRRDRKQVAVMDCQAPPVGEWGYQDQVELLYRWYNNAYLGIEMEGDGFDLSHVLYKRGCTNQYYYRRNDTPTEKPPSDGLGWETNRKSRSSLQNAVIAAISLRDPEGKPEPDLIVCDQETYTQLTEVTRDPDGFIENTSGGKDDHFMALGIALAIDEDPWAPYYPRVQQPPPRKDLNALAAAVGFKVGSGGSRNQPTYDNL